MRLIVSLPVGKAAEAHAQADKRPLSDIVHWDRYGNLRH